MKRFQGMGAVPVKDGIIFSREQKEEKEASLLLYRKGSKEVVKEIPFPKECGLGRITSLQVDQIVAEKYEYNFCVDGMLQQDPYAKLLTGTKHFGEEREDVHAVRCVIPDVSYDWEDDKHPEIPYEEAVMYSLHVRGFTKQKNSKVRHKGTFLGLTEKADYLQELGVNQIKLMPAYEFIELEEIKTSVQYQKEEIPKRLNYWGYTNAYHFAPKAAYAATKDPVREMKDMVKTFHRKGMEVLMEFYFPETCDPRYIVECLQYWVEEYHIDGFHVRGVQNICNLIAADPVFAGTKLLNIYFPVEDIYGKKHLPENRMVAECNDGFLIDIRRFLKGDEESLKAFADRMRRNPKGSGLINYIASHDGFTLCDTVSYEERHNEENGEQNQDGRIQNYSWNCGEEGKSRKKKILELRNRQMKNAWCMLLLSAGTPMILAGDEIANSQQGNNNPYCLDNEVSWVDWKGMRAGNELFAFVKDLIRFRKEHKILHQKEELSMTDSLSCGFPGISYHSSSAWYGELEGQSRKIGIMYCGKYAQEEEMIYTAYNMHWMEHDFALPALAGGYVWSIVLDTQQGFYEQEKELPADSRQVQVPSRTVCVLIGRKQKNVKERNRTLQDDHKA